MKKGEKKGATILMENMILIILNLAFLTILVLFILKQGSGAVFLEEYYAKQVALFIDSAKPGMELQLDMSDAKEITDKGEIAFENAISINDNFVTIKLGEKTGYSYSFFNDVNVEQVIFPEEGILKFKILSYKNG